MNDEGRIFSISRILRTNLPCSFEAVQFLAGPLNLSAFRNYTVSVFVQFPLLEVFVENPNRMKVLDQRYPASFF